MSISQMHTDGIKILVAEDLATLRQHGGELLKQVLENHKIPIKQIEEAADGTEAVRKAKSIKPDFVLMDIAMPNMNGIKAAAELWKELPTLKILFWSQYHHEAYIRELGKIVPDEAIHGYILKSENDETLAKAIELIIIEDLPYVTSTVEEVRHRLRDKSSAINDLEFETLLDIAIGLTDKAIAQKEHISYRGAQNRLSNLLSKLLKGEDSYLKESTGIEIYNPRTRLVFEAFRRGLLTGEELEAQNKDYKSWLFSEYGYES
ncbi:response regulator transcription factor [bacterium]|jgi:DNA-binding NarL/FixJ family response regulator|nr:response regulator transcription factor [bacterium]